MVSKIPLANIKGSKGDKGADSTTPGPRGLPGVNAIPADQAVADYLAAPDSESSKQLNAKIGITAPPPTGVKAVDEANLQPLVTQAQEVGGTIFLQPGTYVMDLVTTEFEQQPRIVGKGEKYTKWDGTLTMNGVSAAFSGGYLSDFSFIGNRAAGEPCLTIRGACSVRWDRIAFSGAADIGILFENDDTHDFTEMSAGQAHFGLFVKKAIEFRRTGGSGASFHACGLTQGSTINQSVDDTGPKILIGPGAEPYNSPLSVTLWARTDVPLIEHRGMTTSTFYGDMKVELLPRGDSETYADGRAVIVDPTSHVLPFTGSLSLRGKYVDPGNLIVGEEAVTETAVATLKTGGALRSTTPGEILRIGPTGEPEWVARTRINRAKNPVVGNNTANFAPYNGSEIAQVTDDTLGTEKALRVTFDDRSVNQGIIYLEPATDLAAGQIKTVACDIYSPVDLTLYAGAWFGLTGSPGAAEVGTNPAFYGDIEYVPAGVVRRIRRVVTVPPPNAGGSLTHEGLYLRTNTTSDAPPNGTQILVSNITIEDGVTSGSKFHGGDALGTEWAGVPDQARSVQYPSAPPVAVERPYTPTLTNVALGSGEVWAYYSRDGKRVTGSLRIKFAADTTVSGPIGFSLPADAPLVGGDPRGYSATGWLNDFSANQRFIATVLPLGTTRFDVRCYGGGNGGFTMEYPVTDTQPVPWGANDELFITFRYEAA